MPENELENELRQLVKEGVNSSLTPVVFPEVQKVEVLNFPEQLAPIVNVPEPQVTVNVPEPKVTVNVPEPKVTVNAPDNSKVFEEIKDLLKKDRTDDLLDAMDSQGKMLVDAYKTVKVIGGNASGAQNLWNAAGTVINPATTEKQDAIVAAIEAIPGGGGVQYTEGDTDATITGTAIMWEDASNTLVVPSSSKPLPVDITQGVDVEFGPGTIDSFGHLITGTINNQIDIQFYRDTVANLTTVTTANGGTASATGGMATFSATTTASSQAKGVSPTSTTYTAGGEIYAIFTAGWTGTGSGTSYQRIGLFDTNNGFFIGYEGGTFYATVRKGGSDVGVAKASFSEDPLTGGTTSLFTRNGTPEAINLTKLNVFRIRFGWVGSAPINFEVLSPDGQWVTFHKIKQPNNASLPHIESADLPVTCDVFSGNSGAALTIITNCWAAGTTQALGKVNATITGDSFAGLQRAVITGETTAGGGGFVNVKVDPSGAVNTSGVITALPNEGQQTMANSISVAIASNQTAVPVSGTFYQATQPVSATDLDIRDLTSTDVVTVTGGAGQTADVKVTLDGESVPVTGTFYQATQPVSATDLDIRNLAKAQDEVYAVLRTDAGAAYDARQVTVQNSSIPVTDNSGSLTVDAPVATPVFVRLSDGAAAITTLPVSMTTPPFVAVTATTADATASGDTTIVSITNTPRLYYIALSANGANSADVTAIVKIGASSKFKVSLKAGAIWAHHIGASMQYLTGSVGDDIVVNLSAAQTVHVSVEYADA
jgi:hypothetical protein